MKALSSTQINVVWFSKFLVKFKIGGSNQIFFPKTVILAYPVPIIKLIILYTFILTLKNMSIFFQIDLSDEKIIHG